MVALHRRQSVEKESIIHYQIRDIKYSREKDKFNIILASYFRGWPRIQVSVTYYNSEHCAISVAYINGVEYRLTTENAKYVEDISQEVTDILRSKIKEVIYGEEKRPKRISIFGPS